MKKKILSLCMVGALAVTAVGGTLAYFTDTEEADNTFTVGSIDITLDEAKVVEDGDSYVVDKESGRVTENEYKLIYPGVELPKDPTIHNTGNNDAYVRVQVTVVNGMTILPTFVDDDTLTDAMYNDAFMNMIGGSLGENWVITDPITATEAMEKVLNSDTNATFEITYAERLASGEDTTAVFENIIIPATWNQEDGRVESIQKTGFEINIVAEAIQAEAFNGYEDAFKAYDAN